MALKKSKSEEMPVYSREFITFIAVADQGSFLKVEQHVLWNYGIPYGIIYTKSLLFSKQYTCHITVYTF